MGTNYPQFLLKTALAANGDKTIPPETAENAGDGRFSQAEGWTEINELPIAKGGIAPDRKDFNGVAFMLSQFLLWYQQGGIMSYSASLDYEAGNEVRYGGAKWLCKKANGASSTVVAPGSDSSYWKKANAGALPGMVCPFANVRLGGSDGRRPIFWGETEADETWVACDGGSDGFGGSVPDLTGRFVRGSSVSGAGVSGGAESAATDNVIAGGTVGGTALTIDQIPSHSHSGSTSSAGNHAHNRGSMNITGTFGFWDGTNAPKGGAFQWGTGTDNKCGKSGRDSGDRRDIYFNAANSWTGETSWNGAHSHTVYMGNTGGGLSHTHSFTAASHSHTVATLPPFLSLAYFVKLPE